MKKWIWALAAVLIVAPVLTGVVLVEHILPRMFVVPHRAGHAMQNSQATPAKCGLRFTPFNTQTSDGLTLKCWFMPGTTGDGAGTVIIFHGWCGCKEQCLDLIRLVVAHGYNAIAFDSRACGESDGCYCTFGFKEKDDVSAIITQAQRDFDTGPLAVLGVSFGGVVGIQAMANDPRIQCGIIVSSFSRLEDVSWVQFQAITHIHCKWIFHRVLTEGEKMANFKVADVQPTEAAKMIKQPVLIIHGVNDNLCPIKNARALFEHIPAKDKEWYAARNSDHDHILTSGDVESINGHMVEFLEKHMPTQAPGH